MKKFETMTAKYLALGVSADNINYAIGSVMEGTTRDITMETLTASYRGMTEQQAAQLLDELYIANGGEFKKENRGGYLYGGLLTCAGLVSAGFLVVMLITGEGKLKAILLATGGTVLGLIQGPLLIIKAIKGKFRDEDAP